MHVQLRGSGGRNMCSGRSGVELFGEEEGKDRRGEGGGGGS